MDDVDTFLSESIKNAAEPGDPSGVAELIRSRVAAGDTGTPSPDGPSFDAGSGWSWLPWVGGGLVVAVAGAAIGVSGLLGGPLSGSEPATGFNVSQFAAGLDCPAGARVVSFMPGDRVLALARSEDSAYLAVRSPYDRSDTVWVALDDLELDPDQPSVASLEVDGCPVPVVTAKAKPSPNSEPQPQQPSAPQPPSPPSPPDPPDPPAPDNAPTLGAASASPQSINTSGSGDTSTVSVSAADDHGVSKVIISWSGADSGSGLMSKSGSNWTFSYHPTPSVNGDVVFTLRAVDTAGQQSSPRSVTVDVFYFG